MGDQLSLWNLYGGLLGLSLLSGCSGSLGDISASNNPNGTVRLAALVEAPLNGFSDIRVDIASVEVKTGTQWVTWTSPNTVYSLLGSGNNGAQLLGLYNVPAGTYTQMRLRLGNRNTVKLSGDNTEYPLNVPSSGILTACDCKVAVGTIQDLNLYFDATHAIQSNGTGNYSFQPALAIYDRDTTSTMTGQLTDTASNPLAGVKVWAETLNATNTPEVVRCTLTDAQGRYILDALPINQTYYIVSQPKTTTAAYGTQVSAGVPLSKSGATNINLRFTASTNPGAINGTISPLVSNNQNDTVYLCQRVNGNTFVVDTTLTVVSGSPLAETYRLSSVPTGDYTVKARRQTFSTTGDVTNTFRVSNGFSVSTGSVNSINLLF